MQVIRAGSAEELWLGALKLCKEGAMVAPRNESTLEVPDAVCLELDNLDYNIVTNPYRGLNYAFALIETLIMWSGRDDVYMYKPYNKNMAKFSDNGITLDGAYGPPFAAQFDYLMGTLNNDRNTRQAVVSIYRPRSIHDVVNVSKDVPCTICLDFKIRDFKLDMTVYMRSNDVWLGLPYDMMNFTTIQKQIAAMLGIFPGIYRHITSALHMYAGDVYKTEFALKYPGELDVKLPDMAEGSLHSLMLIEKALRATSGKLDLTGADPYTDVQAMLLAAYLSLKTENKIEFPSPYKELRGDSSEVRGKFTDSPDRGTVPVDDSGLNQE